MQNNDSYVEIKRKIDELRVKYPCLNDKKDELVFSALCLKNTFYKNPVYNFNDDIINESVVDGHFDGGVDILALDPSSETNDIVIGQSKFYDKISYEDIANAIHKMIDFYKNITSGNYHFSNEKVSKRFLTLYSEVGEESKIIFVFYTSSLKNNIRIDRLNKIIQQEFLNSERIELQVYFGKDLEQEIKESESRRPYVEYGIINIDKDNNYLKYEDQAIICNVSAFSLKTLYLIHNTNLLARNLRYYIKKKDIDDSINETILQSPDTFWFKNNGITIICKNYYVDGNKIKLEDFSIINGGQTTTLIYKNEKINNKFDFYLPCKIIKIIGENEDEKNQFSLDISKAANSQKAIKSIDLKSNAPEQVRFANMMRQYGIFYQTKRGEEVPKVYKVDYLNSDLAEIGKLCLAGIFQLPATSRSKPSILYNEQFYNFIFNRDQKKVCSISRDLLYVDYYFRKEFLNKFDHLNEKNDIIAFAHNARTICLSFIGLAGKYHRDPEHLKSFVESLEKTSKDNFYDDYLYDQCKDLKYFDSIFNEKTFLNKDELNENLYELFDRLIKEGYKNFTISKKYDSSLNETNYLKKDKNYFDIIYNSWDDLREIINDKVNLFVK